MSEPSEIQQNITEAQYAATSGTGNATITITNYYYREEARIAPADSADVADDNLPCPYRGLFHFGPGDAEYFFGRKSFIKTLFQATQTRNFIPLLGASGSGKSSVVFAGLVPKLQQEGHWQFTHFRPGSDPFHALALALVPLYTTNLNETDCLAQARQLANYLRDGDIPLADVFAQIKHNYPSERVLLIADQFEELYTLCPDETIRRNFLDKLTTFPFERVGMMLVLTMRADFLGNALSYRPFADVLQNTDLKLGPMNREELTEVIEKPAQKLGVTLEAGLVERILDGVESEPGNLPLLEFALTELWQRRQGQQLTHVAYTEIGEVQGALARHANEEYHKLSEAQREQMRRIFIQLVRPGEGTEDTRRLATKAELGAVNWALVKQLADARLVVTSRSEKAQVETVEVVHEALIRNWGELRGWMDTDRVFRAWQERLRGAMGQWQETDKDEGSLLRGVALVEAEGKLKERREELSQSERDFIEGSIKLRDRRVREEKDRKRWRIAQIVGTIAFPLIAGVVIYVYSPKPQSPLTSANNITSVAQIPDVTPADEYYETIRGLVERYRIVPQLYSDGRFYGDVFIDRGQFVENLIRILDRLVELTKGEKRPEGFGTKCKLPDFKTIKHSFNPPNDVKPWKSWYYDSYKRLAELTGIGNIDAPFFSPISKKDQNFHSDLPLTRAEMIGGLTRLYDYYLEVLNDNINANSNKISKIFPYKSIKLLYFPVIFKNDLIAQVTSVNEFRDIDRIDKNAWYFIYLKDAVEKYGYTVGKPDRTFGPDDKITRAEFAYTITISMNIIERIISEKLAESCDHK